MTLPKASIERAIRDCEADERTEGDEQDSFYLQVLRLALRGLEADEAVRVSESLRSRARNEQEKRFEAEGKLRAINAAACHMIGVEEGSWATTAVLAHVSGKLVELEVARDARPEISAEDAVIWTTPVADIDFSTEAPVQAASRINAALQAHARKARKT